MSAIDIPRIDPFLQSVGKRVRDLRTRRGTTRKALAHESGVSERYLAQLESGRGNISILLLRQVAQALGADAGELLRLHDHATAEQILIADLVRELSAAEQKTALQLLFDHFSAPHNTRRRIALVGLRAAGKTTLGRLLADRIGQPFIQIVNEIERLGGMSVSEIFSLSGQAGYRRLEERAVMETINNHKSCVLEAGGSIVANGKLYNVLLTSCFVVWLKARPEQHMQRVINQGDLRPISSQTDATADLHRILEERIPFYSQAHAIIDTSDRGIEASLADLMAVVPVLNPVLD